MILHMLWKRKKRITETNRSGAFFWVIRMISCSVLLRNGFASQRWSSSWWQIRCEAQLHFSWILTGRIELRQACSHITLLCSRQPCVPKLFFLAIQSYEHYLFNMYYLTGYKNAALRASRPPALMVHPLQETKLKCVVLFVVLFVCFFLVSSFALSIWDSHAWAPCECDRAFDWIVRHHV